MSADDPNNAQHTGPQVDGTPAQPSAASPDAGGPAPRAKTPAWVPFAVVIGALPAVLALFIFGFIVRFSWAHDERRCPFAEVETRTLVAGVAVREESRRCLDEVEEHRWLVVRGAASPLELGRFPLEAAQVADGFPWEARLEDGRVEVQVENEGRGALVFREPAPEGSVAPDEDPFGGP